VTELLLGDREQAALRALIGSDPVPGVAPAEGDLLRHVGRLVECDALGLALLDGSGSTVDELAVHPARGRDGCPQADPGPATPGIRWRRRTSPEGGPGGLAVLSLGVRNGPDHVLRLWLVRRTSDFTERDRSLIALAAPALERLLRAQPRSSLPPSLTAQERRVLHHVAAGLSNAEIAERLVVAPCTVRKHLENAYRKLGVTNRLAALNALEGARAPDPADLVDVVV
jgi:DNA-binding CsgD family transcriptional regulator